MPEYIELSGHHRIYHIADHIRYVCVDGCVVILDLEAGSYFILDSVASVMWTLLGRHRTAKTVLHELAKQYSIDQAVLASDFSAILDRWISSGFIIDETQRPVLSSSLQSRKTVPE